MRIPVHQRRLAITHVPELHLLYKRGYGVQPLRLSAFVSFSADSVARTSNCSLHILLGPCGQLTEANYLRSRLSNPSENDCVAQLYTYTFNSSCRRN